MRAFLVVLLATLGACTFQGGGSTTVAVPTSLVLPSRPTVPIDSGLGCPNSSDFVERGRVMRIDQPESDTTTVGLIGWTASQGCETFQIDFDTAEGAPATTPPSAIVEYLDSLQVVRVEVNANNTVLTDQMVETGIVDRLYVVRSLDGAMLIDFHLRVPAQARARVSNSPARVIVEFQRTTGAFEGQSALSKGTVLTGPWNGEETATNLEVSGYTRTTGGEILVIATTGDRVVAEGRTEPADVTETWGEFKTRIDLPSGEASLFVGEADPIDGGLSGVTIKIMSR